MTSTYEANRKGSERERHRKKEQEQRNRDRQQCTLIDFIIRQ